LFPHSIRPQKICFTDVAGQYKPHRVLKLLLNIEQMVIGIVEENGTPPKVLDNTTFTKTKRFK